jgi:hypothetical protein
VGTPASLPLDESIALAEQGASIVQLNLPAAVTGPLDLEVAATIVGLLERHLERKTRIFDGGRNTR